MMQVDDVAFFGITWMLTMWRLWVNLDNNNSERKYYDECLFVVIVSMICFAFSYVLPLYLESKMMNVK
jgi:hypothetical protein